MVQDARVRVAALYDIHGNLPALEAVLAAVDEAGVDTIVIGGDVASGPMPAETMALLEARREEVRFVRGNADRVLDFAGNPGGDLELWQQSRLWVAQRLGAERLEFLAGLPLDETIDVDGLGPVRFCHGAPGSDEEVITLIRATGYPNRETYVLQLADEDPERPERMSRRIEFGPD